MNRREPTRAAAAGAVPFAALLRGHRLRLGLTQRQLADLAGLGVRTIVDLERGRVARPQRDSVRMLGDALRLEGVTRLQFELVAGGADPGAPGGAAEPLPAPGQL